MLNNSTLVVLIFTREITNNPEKLTIYTRITIIGRRAEISLKRYTSVNVWDVSKGHWNHPKSQTAKYLFRRGLHADFGGA